VLDGFGAYPAVIDAELRKYLPFLATTKFLVAAVKAGTGREQAHEVIKTHAVAYALALREKPDAADDLPARLGADERFPLSEAEIRALLSEPLDFVGDARRQTATFVARVADVVARHPQAATFQPEPIL
jgi:adenylosuccinate lyase